MKARTRPWIALSATVVTVCLFALGQSASAQSVDRPCREAKGQLNEVGNSTGTPGTITHGGILDGTTQLLYTSDSVATPDPTTISYTDDLTVTTRRGVLRTHEVGVFEFERGVFTSFGRIDSNASTGQFRGAKGMLFIHGKTTDGGATFRSHITGKICLVRAENQD